MPDPGDKLKYAEVKVTKYPQSDGYPQHSLLWDVLGRNHLTHVWDWQRRRACEAWLSKLEDDISDGY